jgi:Ras-related protein Rab-1A
MFEDIGEPAPEFRDSETTDNNDNDNKNRYTQVDNDILFNPIEGYEEEKIDQDVGDKKEDIKEEEKEKVDLPSKNPSMIIKPNKEIKKLKIILLGEIGVGKTSIIKKYVGKNNLNDNPENDFVIKNYDIDENTTAELTIYDTTNEEKLGKITKNYYKDAHGALIVFDLTNKESFNKVKYWLKEIDSNAPRDIVLCLLGNKADLTYDRIIQYEDAKEIAGDNLYYEISSKTGNNVSLAFEQLTYEIIEKQNEEKDNPDKVLRGKEGRRTADLNDINEMNKDLFGKKKCCQ